MQRDRRRAGQQLVRLNRVSAVDERASGWRLMNTDPEAFAEHGYVVFRSVLTESDIARLTHRVSALADQANQDGVLPAEALSYEGLEWVVSDPRILAAVKSIGIDPTVYFGDSTISFRVQSGFHRDNVDREDQSAPDWRSPYDVVRVAIYLQDHDRHALGLQVQPGSHLPLHTDTHVAYVASRLGDVVAWNLRLLHSGNGGRHLPLPGQRLAVFCTYGRPGTHLDRYVRYLVTRRFYSDVLRNSTFHAGELPGLSVVRPDLPENAGANIKHRPLPY